MNRIVYSFCIAFLVLAINADLLDINGRKACLSEHNKHRTMLADGKAQTKGGLLPPASNMNEVSYSKSLEAEAEKWVLNLNI
jgi:hypothetical protein